MKKSIMFLLAATSLFADNTYNSTFTQAQIKEPSNYSSSIKKTATQAVSDQKKKEEMFMKAASKDPNHKFTVGPDGKIHTREKEDTWVDKMKNNVYKDTDPIKKTGNEKVDTKAKLDRKLLMNARNIALKISQKETDAIKDFKVCLGRMTLTNQDEFKQCQSKKAMTFKMIQREESRLMGKLKASYREALKKYGVEDY